MEIVIGIIGLVVGLVIGILVTRAQKSALEVKANALSDEVARLKEEIALQKSEMNGLVTEKQELATKCEVLTTQKDNVEAKAREEAEKYIKDIAAQEETFAKQMASVKEDNEQKCKDLQERHSKEIAMLNDSHQRELQSKIAEHEKAIISLKEHQEKETNSLMENSDKLLQAKDVECQKSINALTTRYDQEIDNIKASHAETEKNWQAEKSNIQAHNAELIEAKSKQIAELKADFDQQYSELKETHAQELSTLKDSYMRELQNKIAEHENAVAVIKEHHEKEVNTLKASFEESRENWMSERRTIDENNQKLLKAKDEECQKAIDVLKSRYEQEIANLTSLQEEAGKNWAQEKQRLQAHGNELLQAKETEHKAILAAQEKRHNEAVQSMKQTFAETIDHLKANLKAATEDMLKMRQAEFTDINKQNMQSIVDPLNETIAKMKQAMDGYSKEQNEFSGSMKTSIQTIIQQTETARQSAIELTTALKHDTKMQGDYGEAILDEILSKQGFTEGIHYELQYVMKDEDGRELKGDDGKGLRPDVLFHIDTVRDVIIDSKVNLTDFINFANAETADERKMHLERHVKSIESQVKLLSQKNYFKYHKKTNARMDYVIMFVPISAAWWEALRYKPSLWREAMDSNVYIADEQTLFAALRIIKLTWTQIAQVKSQKEIFDLVNQMIDRVGQFMKSYKAIGEAIGKAQDAYDKGYEKLTPGGQSILTTTTNLLKLGGRDSKTNPVAKFIDVDDIPALPEPD